MVSDALDALRYAPKAKEARESTPCCSDDYEETCLATVKWMEVEWVGLMEDVKLSVRCCAVGVEYGRWFRQTCSTGQRSFALGIWGKSSWKNTACPQQILLRSSWFKL